MRQIIDGTAYDTETAERVKERPLSEEETIILYRNRHGAFFFYERTLQPYFDADAPFQEAYYIKEELVPCTDESAQKWLEEHGNGLVEQYFGEMPEARSAERRLAADGRGGDAMALQEGSEKIMNRSHQRSGVVAEGTRLSSGARQVTVSFLSSTFDKLKLAAETNKVSLSEMVRQCVDRALSGA